MPRVPKNYPPQFANQEAQLIAQIEARRRAFLEQHGQAQEQFVNNPPRPQRGGNLLGDQYNDPGSGDDLFEGDILD